MSKKFEVNTHDFNPLNITGLKLYLNRYNATPSSWLDVSSNGYNFVQATATKQPVIGINNVAYDGVNDWQGFNISNVWSGDSSGIFFFSGYRPTAGGSIYLCSADNSTTNSHIFFNLSGAGQLYLQVKDLPTFDNIMTSTNSISVGDYFYGYIKSDGSTYTMNLNGVNETLVVVSGVNDGKWFSNVPSRDNLTIASIIRTTIVVNKPRINKTIYSNAALSSGEIDDIMNFMSDENN